MRELEHEFNSLKPFGIIFDLPIEILVLMPIYIRHIEIQHDLRHTYFIDLITDSTFIYNGNLSLRILLSPLKVRLRFKIKHP